jgi:phage terminase small subunit
MKDRRQGLDVTERPVKEVTNGNQWTLTPRQIRFVELWLTPKSPTFGNAYQSAKEAGYSDGMAVKITSKQLSLEWVAEAKKRLINLEPNHTVKALEHMALHAKQDRDRIKALELVGKIQGLFIDRSISHVDVQFTNEVPRPIIDLTNTQNTSETSPE